MHCDCKSNQPKPYDPPADLRIFLWLLALIFVLFVQTFSAQAGEIVLNDPAGCPVRYDEQIVYSILEDRSGVVVVRLHCDYWGMDQRLLTQVIDQIGLSPVRFRFASDQVDREIPAEEIEP